MEDWIRNVESIMGENADGDRCPEVLQFDDEEDADHCALSRRLAAFLRKTTPSSKFVEELADVLDDVLHETVTKTAQFWSGGSVSAQGQSRMNEYFTLMNCKTHFLAHIYVKLLQSHQWKDFGMDVYKNMNRLLLKIIPIIEKYPFNSNDTMTAFLHFRVKAFVSIFSINIWNNLFIEDEDFARFLGSPSSFSTSSSSSARFHTKFPTELLLPTLRRLGMLDCLDPDWNTSGDWNELISELSRNSNKPITKIHADHVLEEKTKLLRNARNSMNCRTLFHPNIGPAPQCFNYYPKCSVKGCQNVETKDKPHKFRCQVCWYFHFCSKSCQAIADMCQLHQCSFTPRDKAEKMRKETGAYLGWNKEKIIKQHRLCNFCHTLRNNTEAKKFLQCSRCQIVGYCDNICQKWDWPNHKLHCKKK